VDANTHASQAGDSRGSVEHVPELSKRVATLVLTATILGSALSFIDGTVVNVALPTLQRYFHANAADVQWVIQAYALFLASLILVGGSIGDRLGRKRVFVAGVVLFTLASIACGVAPSLIVLVIARAVQGIGGALLVPGSLSIIGATFPEQRRGAAIGTWSAMTTVTTALGPVLGGWLVQSLSWRWIFFINVPIAVVTLAITLPAVPETFGMDAGEKHLDLTGAGLGTLGLGAITYGLVESSARGLGAPLVVITIVCGVALLGGFITYERWLERQGKAPMVPLSIFRSRTFSGANLLTFTLYGGLGGALYFLPFNLQLIQGYTAAEAGAALLPFTVIIFSLSRWSGSLVQRVGAKVPLIIGPLVVGLGFVLFSLPGVGGTYWTTWFPGVVVLSLGMALVIAPLTTAVMNALGAERSGVASGVNNAVSRTGGLLAIAVLNLIVVSVFSQAFSASLAHLDLSASVHHALETQRTQLAAIAIPSGVSAAVRASIQHAIATAFVQAFRVAMLVGAGLAFVSAIAAGALISGESFREVFHLQRVAPLTPANGVSSVRHNAATRAYWPKRNGAPASAPGPAEEPRPS
jgi:EmrB/QacA subfamily drug resistance transporter